MATAHNSNTSTAKRTSTLTSVRVVVRDLPGALASDLVPELIESFLDYSVRWNITRAACEGHMHLLTRLGDREMPITERQMDWAMRVAADKGDLRVLQWLTTYRPEYTISTSVMDSAAFAGNLTIIKWLHENRSEGCTTHAMDSAAACGHLEIVKWLHHNRSEGCSTAAMDTAAAGGHLRVLRWLDANRKEGCSTVAMDFAIFNGHLHVVQWLNEYRAERCPTSARAPSGRHDKRHEEPRKLVLFIDEHDSSLLLTSVAVVLRAKQHAYPPLWDIARTIECLLDQSGHWSILLAVQEELPHLLRRLIAMNRDISVEKLGVAMQTAAKKGDLSALQSLHAYRPQTRIPRAVMNKAAERGHLHIVQWLHHSTGSHCSEKALESAAMNGNLYMAQWLYEHERESSSNAKQAMQLAARGGHVVILQFLDAQQHDGCMRTAAMRAAEFGRVSVLQYLQQRHPDEFLTNDLLAIARKCKKPKVVQWLSEL